MSDARPPEDGDELEEEEALEKSPRSSGKIAPAPARPPGRQALESKQRAPAAPSEEELPYIDDRASKIWVAAIVGVFALILAYGLLFGKGGALSPATPSPPPTATPSPSVSVSPTPSGSVTPAPTVTLTPAPSGSATPAPSGSATPAPSGSATPAPTVTPSAAPTITPSAAPTVAPSVSPTPAPSST